MASTGQVQQHAQPAPHATVRVGQVQPATIYIADCGSWTVNVRRGQPEPDRFFGVMSGSTFVIGSFAKADKATPTDGALARSKRASDLLRSVSAYPRAFSAFHAEPASLEECESPEEILTGSDELYVFLPDCHLGIGDKADDFRKNAENASKLESFLRTCKAMGAIIVQTGDFLDIWEAEAELAAYYQPGADGGYQCRTREERLAAAARRLDEQWSGPCASLLQTAEECIGVYLPGNHDTETRFQAAKANSGPVSSFVRAKVGAKLPSGSTKLRYEASDTRLVAERGASASVRWWAEHGNIYDSSNNTFGRDSLDDIMTRVRGKAITFAWARAERGEKLWYRQAPGFSDTGPTPSIDPAEGQTWDIVFSMQGALISSAIGYFESLNFDGMRAVLEKDLIARTREKNPAVPSMTLRGQTLLVDVAVAQEALRLPTRLVVHSHTHTPKVSRLSFVPIRRRAATASNGGVDSAGTADPVARQVK